MAPIINGKNVYNSIFNWKVMKKLMPATPTEMAGTLALVSTITKDAVNCYYYTTQSLKNEKIPEEKRKFVAGIDLSNGILNVLVPGALGTIINKNSKGLFKKWFSKYFNEEAGKKMYQKLSKLGMSFTEESVISGLAKNKKYAEAGFKVMAVLLITQVIGKRVINPFLSTPMASVFKNQMDKREQKNKKANEGNSDTFQQGVTLPEVSAFKQFYELVSKPVTYK